MRVGVERAASWVGDDGQRFLVLKPMGGLNAPPAQLIVVQHFDEMLKRLVPMH